MDFLLSGHGSYKISGAQNANQAAVPPHDMYCRVLVAATKKVWRHVRHVLPGPWKGEARIFKPSTHISCSYKTGVLAHPDL